MATLQFTSKNGITDFTTYYAEPIVLHNKKKYEAALIELSTFNSIPNIKKNVNNIFHYSTDNGIVWKEIVLNTGSYELSDITNEIERQMVTNGDYNMTDSSFYIVIEPNLAELKSVLTIKHDTYQVSFGGQYSIGKLLGFPNGGILKKGRNVSPKPVDINPVISISVNTDLVNGRYLNGAKSSTIHSFTPPVGPGRVMIIVPRNLIYIPVSHSEISSIRIWLTDQNQTAIRNRNESIVVVLHIREVKERNQERAFVNAMKTMNGEL